MAINIIKNTSAAEDPPDAPTRDDGTLYPYGMHFDGGKYIAFADTTEELLNVLIPNYLELDEQEKLVERIKFGLLVQTIVQASVNSSVEPEDWGALEAYQREVLTGSRNEQPRGWSIDEPLGDLWECEVPLILVDTGYSPYTEVPRPVSVYGDYDETPNIFWITPVEEEDFLDSLSALGYIILMRANNSV